MSQLPAASCTVHPGRPVSATCTRCGAFLCDWCVKLAPSWGPGLCQSCQKVKHVEAAPAITLSRPLVLVSTVLMLRPWLGIGAFFSDLGLGADARAAGDTALATQALGLAAADALLTVLAFVASALFFLRLKVARPLLVGLFAADLVDQVVPFALGHPNTSGAAILALGAVRVLVVVWLLSSAEVDRMLVR